ncbi:MAG TPA: response regulator transcription factor [Candidatus Limnocylindrales bacterium]|nr:response regulator transcription factor [Candidatus Limnocylindrales bacterium]
MEKSENKIRKYKIIIADDDQAICDSMSMILVEMGYMVETTGDSNTLSEIIKNKPDLLLLDIWMSGMDGRDIAKQLKANKDTQSIPIIMISATRDIMKSAKVAGADDFITKPFTMEELLIKVAKYCKTS